MAMKVLILILILCSVFDRGLQKPTFPDFYPLPFHATSEITTIRIDEEGKHSILLALDKEGVPCYYFSELFTEVCHNKDCKPVRVNIYWDLRGNYLKYELPDSAVLTKMDHADFLRYDYEKLHRILSNKHSVLGEYALAGLVSKQSGEVLTNVDGVSGATITTVKNDVIEGAAFTCHTLWHLVHRHQQQFEQYFDEKLNADVLCILLKQNYLEHHHLALDRIGSTSVVDTCLQDALWSIIESDNVFLAKRAFTSLPLDELNSARAQKSIWNRFSHLSYTLQSVVLERIKSGQLSEELLIKVAKIYPKASYEQCKNILIILERHESWSEALYDPLLTIMANGLRQYRQLTYEFLSARDSTPSWVEKILEEYER